MNREGSEGLGEEVLGEALHFARERGREQQRLPNLGVGHVGLLDDLPDLRLEPEVSDLGLGVSCLGFTVLGLNRMIDQSL